MIEVPMAVGKSCMDTRVQSTLELAVREFESKRYRGDNELASFLLEREHIDDESIEALRLSAELVGHAHFMNYGRP